MRLFIAIEISDEIKNGMAEAQTKLKVPGVDASWTRPEGVHLTLKFLGETPEAKVAELMTALSVAVKGSGIFHLDVAGTGAFPNPKSARVVWIGLAGETEKLARLQSSVEEAMNRLGFAREVRAFTPHLTLGRIKYVRSREAWLAALDGVKDIKLPGFDVSEISLMKSELKRDGAVYTELGKIELK